MGLEDNPEQSNYSSTLQLELTNDPLLCAEQLVNIIATCNLYIHNLRDNLQPIWGDVGTVIQPAADTQNIVQALQHYTGVLNFLADDVPGLTYKHVMSALLNDRPSGLSGEFFDQPEQFARSIIRGFDAIERIGLIYRVNDKQKHYPYLGVPVAVIKDLRLAAKRFQAAYGLTDSGPTNGYLIENPLRSAPPTNWN